MKLDANYFRRLVNNYADDDQIENTTISYPIAFRKSIIYGAEAKLMVPDWHGFSGFASYSYIVGQAWFPVTGGLFLGDDAELPTTGHIPDSQDQRNTVRARVRLKWLRAFGSREGFSTIPGSRLIFSARTAKRWRNASRE